MKLSVLFLLAVGSLFAQTPPPHPAWSGDKVHEIRLKFKQADYWAQLTKNYLGTEIQAEYLEGAIEWGPYEFDSVGVRFKGNSSIGGQTSTVAYGGVAGGSVPGLYQVNAAIPANAASGNQPVVVAIGGVASQSGVTVSVQ